MKRQLREAKLLAEVARVELRIFKQRQHHQDSELASEREYRKTMENALEIEEFVADIIRDDTLRGRPITCDRDRDRDRDRNNSRHGSSPDPGERPARTPSPPDGRGPSYSVRVHMQNEEHEVERVESSGGKATPLSESPGVGMTIASEPSELPPQPESEMPSPLSLRGPTRRKHIYGPRIRDNGTQVSEEVGYWAASVHRSQTSFSTEGGQVMQTNEEEPANHGSDPDRQVERGLEQDEVESTYGHSVREEHGAGTSDPTGKGPCSLTEEVEEVEEAEEAEEADGHEEISNARVTPLEDWSDSGTSPSEADWSPDEEDAGPWRPAPPFGNEDYRRRPKQS